MLSGTTLLTKRSIAGPTRFKLFSISPVKELKPDRPAKPPAPCSTREFASVLKSSLVPRSLVTARLAGTPARLADAYISLFTNLAA